MVWRRLRSLFSRAAGGVVPPPPAGSRVPIILSPGGEITDPDEAEALGLTVDARRMRKQRGEGR